MIHLITFRLGLETYALRIDQVREVTITPPITRMPGMPHYLRGVTNIRGSIIPVMDLEARFKLTNTVDSTYTTYLVVIEGENDYNLGIIVSEVPQSLTVPKANIDRSSTRMASSSGAAYFIEGVAVLPERLILVLDATKVLSQEEGNDLSQKISEIASNLVEGGISTPQDIKA